MDHIKKHFTRDESPVESYGPFSFLNPTTRKYPLHFEGIKRQSSKKELESKENGALNGAQKSKATDEELRARDVHRLFRTRDNRKGMSSQFNNSARIC